MSSSQKRRLTLVLVGMGLIALVLVGRLFRFQIVEAEELGELGEIYHTVIIEALPQRGLIYDRNMTVLAGNGADYRVAANPPLIAEGKAAEVAAALAPVLNRPVPELHALLTADRQYTLLSTQQVPAAVAEEIRGMEIRGIELEEVPRRIYPQGDLLCHALGYANWDNTGMSGIEGYYETDLAGEGREERRHFSPLNPQDSVIAREGVDLVLTIDRSVQYLVESHLARAMVAHRPESASILVLDPRSGAVLAMASAPCFDPYRFFDENPARFLNPAVSQQFEPGSVMKLITMAAALDSGATTPNGTYYDPGYIEIGGQVMYNWDRSAPGETTMETLLARSLNVGAATLALRMGADTFYDYLLRFGFAQPTRVDLMSEAVGLMPLPGDRLWTETNIGTNAFGQGMAVTPLQMIAATSALANDGVMMQPYLVAEIHQNDGTVFVREPAEAGRPVSALTARQVSSMAVNAVRQEVPEALVNGFTIAGKTSSAQIPEGGVYDPNDIIGVFIGWLPADQPELIVLVKLDRPQSAPWGSQTAAPVFGELVRDLVVMLDIPPDTVRHDEDISRVRSNP